MLERIKKAQQKRMDGENRPKQEWKRSLFTAYATTR
jgi:hypothetical protein